MTWGYLCIHKIFPASTSTAFKNHCSTPAWSTPAAHGLLLLRWAQTCRESHYQSLLKRQTEIFPSAPQTKQQLGLIQQFGVPSRIGLSVTPCRKTGSRGSTALGFPCPAGAGSAVRPAHHICKTLYFTRICWVFSPDSLKLQIIFLLSRSSNSTLRKGLRTYLFSTITTGSFFLSGACEASADDNARPQQRVPLQPSSVTSWRAMGQHTGGSAPPCANTKLTREGRKIWSYVKESSFNQLNTGILFFPLRKSHGRTKAFKIQQLIKNIYWDNFTFLAQRPIFIIISPFWVWILQVFW